MSINFEGGDERLKKKWKTRKAPNVANVTKNIKTVSHFYGFSWSLKINELFS